MASATTDATGGPYGRALHFFSNTIWRPDVRALPRRRAFGYRVARVLYVAVRGFRRDDCPLRAAALTFTTILSIIPLLAFAFSLLKGLGAYATLRSALLQPVLDEAFGDSGIGLRGSLDQVLELVSHARVGGLGAFGLVTFVLAALALLDGIETTFNRIWDVRAPRSIVRKLTDYVALIVVTPIAVTTLAAVLATVRGSAAVEVVLGTPWAGTARPLIARAGLLAGSWLAMAVLYFVLPNTRTPVRSVLLGAFVAGTGWAALSMVHVRLQVGVAHYGALYSGFAALPIFLGWLYASWQVILLGAEVVAAHRSVETHRWRALGGAVDQRFREILALRALRRIARTFVAGGSPLSTEDLARELAVPEHVLGDVLEPLAARAIVARTADGAFVPRRALDRLRVLDVLEALRVAPGEATARERAVDDEPVARLVRQMDAALEKSAASMTLRDLAEEPPASDGPDAGRPTSRGVARP